MSEAGAQKAATRLKASAEIKASKSNVVQQAKLLDEAGSAWHAVKYGNLEMITRLFPSQSNVYQKGPVGENVFHIALLLNTPSTLAIAKYLVKLYGRTLVNTPYQERKHEQDAPGLYEGETALHIAIVNRDNDMVKFLIQSGAEVRVRCYGGFFAWGSPVYYGEYPMSFAAATGQKDIVSYLKRHGARVNHDCDMYGNTALHVAVVHEQLDMYDHLVEYCGASEHARNNRGATPLLLAASLGKLEVFQHIYNRRRKVAWAYGPVTSYSLSLYEIDTVRSRNRKAFVPSAIEIIVRKGHMHMMDDPLVKTLLTSKWQRFAAAQFLLHGSLYLMLVVLQTFLVWLLSSIMLFDTPARAALEVVTVVMAVGFLALEVLDVTQWVLSVHRRRQLMKTALAFYPPLYPIPGEVTEAQAKSKGSFLTRLVKGAVAEGAEHAQRPQPNPGTATRPQPALALEQPASSTAASSSNTWWGADAAACSGGEAATAAACGGGAPGPLGPGPVAEAGLPAHAQLDTSSHNNSGSLAATPSQINQTPLEARLLQAVATMGSATPPVHSGTKPHMMPALRGSRAAMRPDNPRVSDIVSVGLFGTSSTVSTGGGGNPGTPSNMQRAPSFFVTLPPSAAPSPAGIQAQSSMVAHNPSVAEARCKPSGMSVSLAAANALAGLQFTGTSGSAQTEDMAQLSGVGGGLGGPGAPSMRVGGGGTLAPMMEHAEDLNLHEGGAYVPAPGLRGLDGARSLGGSLSGVTALDGRKSADSAISSSPGEIKNRIRGGGGGDYQAGGGMTKRRDNKSGAHPAEEEPVEDIREPLHVGGGLGTVQLLQHSLTGYYSRQLQDPVALLMACHLLLTLVHFITWASTYGGVRGEGPSNPKVSEFDDIIVSLMALTGWLSVIYFARGIEHAGQLAVLVEMCVLEVVKYATIYFIFNIGFTLAFYTVLRGTYFVTVGEGSDSSYDPAAPTLDDIGFTMIQLLRFMYGEAEYSTYSNTPSRAKMAVATCYFILYICAVLLLLGNLLTAIIMHAYQAHQGQAQKIWLLRWASYVLRAEVRMSLQAQHRYRLGEVSYDPVLQTRVYNHVFEVVEEAGERSEDRDKDIKALEALLASMRRANPGAGNPGSKK